MRLPSIEGLAPASAGRRGVGLCLSSVVLTPSGSNRPTTFRTSTPAIRASAPHARAHQGVLRRHGAHAAACANSLAGRGWLWSVTHEGRRQDAAPIRKETQAMPPKQRPRTGHGHLRKREATGCSSSPRWLSARRVLPHFGHRRTSASAPCGGSPAPLRAPAPRAGRRLFWAASLAPPTTKQEEQQ